MTRKSVWPWATLEDVLARQSNKKLVQQGWSPRCHTHAAEGEDWGVLKTTAIQPGRFDPSANKALPVQMDAKPSIEVQPGDLLITCAGPRARCGVPALVRSTPPRLMMSGKMYRLRPLDLMDPRFLELWLLSPQAQAKIDAMKTGISESGLNLTHARFLKLPVPVPPLPDQLNVVQAIEAHVSHIEAADAAIQRAERRLTTLLAARTDRIQAGELVRLDSITVDSGYGTSMKCAADGEGLPVLRIPNLVDGRIDLADLKNALDTSVDLEPLKVRRGDVLLVRTNGSRNLIGRTAVAEADLDAAFASYLIRFRFDESRVLPEWVSLMLNAPRVRTTLERLAASSAGQYNLGLKKLGGVEIPCPPLDDQRRRIAQVRDLAWEVHSLRGALSAGGVRSRNLRHAVLEAAFSGELTA